MKGRKWLRERRGRRRCDQGPKEESHTPNHKMVGGDTATKSIRLARKIKEHTKIIPGLTATVSLHMLRVKLAAMLRQAYAVGLPCRRPTSAEQPRRVIHWRPRPELELPQPTVTGRATFLTLAGRSFASYPTRAHRN
jgi:hypothetical protein